MVLIIARTNTVALRCNLHIHSLTNLSDLLGKYSDDVFLNVTILYSMYR